jgi:hypothetical protein
MKYLFFRNIAVCFLIIGSFFKVSAQQSKAQIVSGTFYKSGIMGPAPTEYYMSSDSSFVLELKLMNPDTFHKVQVVWYYENREDFSATKLDSSVFGIRNVEGPFVVDFFRKSYAWPVGFYYVKVYLDGVFQEQFPFVVSPEEVLSAQFFTIKKDDPQGKLIPKNTLNKADLMVVARVFLDRIEVKDSSTIEAVWFFELEGDEPLFLTENKTMLVDKKDQAPFNFIDFNMGSKNAWPNGALVMEVWVNGAFKKYFKIPVNYD